MGLIKAFIVKVYGSCKLITLNTIKRHVEIYSGTLMMMMVIVIMMKMIQIVIIKLQQVMSVSKNKPL